MANTVKHYAIQQVSLELSELKKLGVKIPLDPENLTAEQEATIVDSYENSAMKISEIADSVILMAMLQ